jgi:hypothetical protein
MNNSQTIPTTTLSRRQFLKLSGLGLVGTTLLSQLPTAYRDVSVTYNAQWWDNNREAVEKRFNEWVRS